MLPNNHLQMTSEVARGFGARVVREFWFEQNGDFAIAQTVEKVKGEPLLLSIWNVTQIEPLDAIFVLLNSQSVYKNNFHWFLRRMSHRLCKLRRPWFLRRMSHRLCKLRRPY